MQSFDLDSVEPLLWSSRRAGCVSAWHGHVSFAHWLVHSLRPGMVVELGSHNGVSFVAFCHAAASSRVAAKCFAVDTWRGDDHAGYYDESVYQDLSAFVAENFAKSAALIRSYFDEALPLFAEGSIDLLHIDGLHTYDAVRHDFEAWLPKLSSRGVVLLHDTMIRTGTFGVWRLWDELVQRYPGFNFHHSSGLGVLAVGSAVPAAVAQLCRGEMAQDAESIRHRFAQASVMAQQSGLFEAEQTAQRRLSTIAAQGVNVALNRPAFQSSALGGTIATPQGAVNGAKTGKYGFHTSKEASAWWMVDLGSVQAIDELVVYNRLDSACEHRARSLAVLRSDDGESWRELYRHHGPAFGGADGRPLCIPCRDTQARFIRLKLTEPEFLHLDEVEIYRLSDPASVPTR